MSDHADHVHAAPDLTRGTWVRVASGPKMYIGRVHLIDLEDPYTVFVPQEEGAPKAKRREEVPVHEVLAAKKISLMPAYELIADMQRVPIVGPDGKVQMNGPIPQTGLSRTPLVTGLDFLLHPIPFHILTIDAVYFNSQAHPDDQKTLRAFADSAEKRNEMFRVEALKEATGIMTPAEAAELERQKRARRG